MEAITILGDTVELKTRPRYEITATGKWIIWEEGMQVTNDDATYKLGLKPRPPTIDIESQKWGLKILGIFKLDGDVLTICAKQKRRRAAD